MSNQGQPIQTIRLGARDRRRLVESINAKGGRGTVDSEKRNIRVDFQRNDVIAVITQPNGMVVKHKVVTRNLSRWGIAFVHGQFVYPESGIEMIIPTLDRKAYVIKGSVVRCRHVQGLVHEVAVKFVETIELELFVVLSAEQRERHKLESGDEVGAEADDVAGMAQMRAVVVDEMRSDRKLFALYLSDLDIETIEAVGAAQALNQLMRDPVDLIIVDSNLGEQTGAALIKRIRDEKIRSMIIAVSADDSPQGRQEMLDAGADEFLYKPFERGQLFAMAGALLGVDEAVQETDPIFSSKASDDGMRPIIEDFVSDLGTYIGKLHQAVTAHDYGSISGLCHKLKGGGGGYGFDAVTDVARRAVDAIETEPRDDITIRQAINELIAILRRVKFE